jgi:alpha-mannosidase
MMLAHTDIGYTHPQPVVKEIHNSTLDDVVVMCREYPDFKWTIETLWQLEQYELSRSPEQFNSLIEFIKSGRIAVSPLYTNPFTGWTGEEEMIRSLDKAKYFKNKYGWNIMQRFTTTYRDNPG